MIEEIVFEKMDKLQKKGLTPYLLVISRFVHESFVGELRKSSNFVWANLTCYRGMLVFVVDDVPNGYIRLYGKIFT